MADVAAPTPLKNKRKVFQDDFTPRSSHIDKRVIPGTTAIPSAEGQDATHYRRHEQNGGKENSGVDEDDLPTPGKQQVKSIVKSPSKSALSERFASDDNIARHLKDPSPSPEAAAFDGLASTGSVLSQPDFSASVLQHASSSEMVNDQATTEAPEADEPDAPDADTRQSETVADADDTQVTATPRASRSPVPFRHRSTSPTKHSTHAHSPTRTPRLLRDFPIPLTTPRNLIEAALQGRGQHPIQQLQMQHQAEQARLASQPNTPIRASSTQPTNGANPAGDLLSFQTPAPRPASHESDLLGEKTLGAPASAALQRFKTGDGEEMLLDMTPRVYSPRSIPLYTLDDMEMLKREFSDAQRMLEEKIESLHTQLAASVSHANHHAALATQADSLHLEYSKKHVRKVTALKQDWDRKLTERLARQRTEMEAMQEALQAQLKQKDAQLEELTQQLAQERLEKKEVIEMGEQILAMVGNSAAS